MKLCQVLLAVSGPSVHTPSEESLSSQNACNLRFCKLLVGGERTPPLGLAHPDSLVVPDSRRDGE